MESGDLRVALGLSSYKSDLQWYWIGIFESMQRIEFFYNFRKMDDFSKFNPYLEISKEFYYTTDADEVRFDLYNVNSFSSKLVRILQFKICSHFKTGAGQLNLHTLIRMLASVDTVEIPVARV